MVSEFLLGGISLIQQPKVHQSEQRSARLQQFLRFYLANETTALLPVQQMTEVLNIPVHQIVPIPHLPRWVMGIYNWRGEILWIVDLGHLVGLSSVYQQAITRSHYTVIVIHSSLQGGGKAGSQSSGRKMLGLVVNRVEDMEWCNPDSIQSPPQSTVTPELVPFLRGYWLKPNGEMLVVLDSEAIVAGMPKPEAATTE